MLKNTKSVALSCLAGIGLLLSGCLWTPEFSQILAQLRDQMPGVHFKKEIELNLGPTALGFARTVISLVPDEGDEDLQSARSYLREIRSVKVAIYKVYDAHSVEDVKIPAYVRKLLKRNNWETVAKVQEGDGIVYVLYKPHRKTIKEMFVMSLSDDELVMVQAEGRLDRLFEKVLEDHADVGGLFRDI